MSTAPRGGLYLFLGPDRARKLQRIQALERHLGISYLDRHQLDASVMTSAELLALARQQPAMSPVRLIVVDEAHRLDQACVEALVQHHAVIAKTASVVLLVEKELSVRHGLAQAHEAIVTERFPAREALSAKPFALTDALGTNDLPQALGAVHDQLVAGKEPLEILGLVAWQLQRWVLVKRLLATGYSAEQIASVTRLRPWQLQRLQTELTRRSLPSLQRLLTRCWQLDVDAKSGRALPGLAIEQLVMEVCVSAG